MQEPTQVEHLWKWRRVNVLWHWLQIAVFSIFSSKVGSLPYPQLLDCDEKYWKGQALFDFLVTIKYSLMTLTPGCCCCCSCCCCCCCSCGCCCCCWGRTSFGFRSCCRSDRWTMTVTLCSVSIGSNSSSGNVIKPFSSSPTGDKLECSSLASLYNLE